MKRELLKGLNEEQIEKARACKSSGELLELAKKEGIELNDEQLEAVSGGNCFAPRQPAETVCPQCGNTETRYDDFGISDTETTCHCDKCGLSWRSPLR